MQVMMHCIYITSINKWKLPLIINVYGHIQHLLSIVRIRLKLLKSADLMSTLDCTYIASLECDF